MALMKCKTTLIINAIYSSIIQLRAQTLPDLTLHSMTHESQQLLDEVQRGVNFSLHASTNINHRFKMFYYKKKRKKKKVILRLHYRLHFKQNVRGKILINGHTNIVINVLLEGGWK